MIRQIRKFEFLGVQYMEIVAEFYSAYDGDYDDAWDDYMISI